MNPNIKERIAEATLCAEARAILATIESLALNASGKQFGRSKDQRVDAWLGLCVRISDHVDTLKAVAPKPVRKAKAKPPTVTTPAVEPQPTAATA